jgi:histidine triad (HIT) family protein
VLEADPAVLAKTIAGVQTVVRHYVDDCGFEGANVLTFAEECAGQSVFHLHFHIYPRKSGDGVFQIPKVKKCKFSLDEMQKKLQF